MMICLRGMLLVLIGVGLPTVMLRIYAFAHDDLVFMWEKNGDVFIVNGSPLVLNCTNTRSSVPNANVSKLRILKGSENVSAIFLHTYFEDRTLQLLIPHAQINDSATYVCMDDVNIPKLKMVKIGVEPSLPENITCISENFQNLVCSFNKPSTTYIPMKWSMEYSFDDSNFEKRTVNGSCPTTEESLVMVHCSLNEKYLFIFENYIVTLNMYNTVYGLSKKMTVEIVLDESIVRPNVVDNLTVTQWEYSRGVKINWTSPHDLPSDIKLIYRVTLHNQWGEQKSWNMTNTGGILTDLIPYTKYSFEVKCKPVRAEGEVYWSTPAIRNFTTHPDLPAEGPIVTEGAFVQRNCETEGICLVLYWKKPPAWQINGELVGYKIIIASYMKNEMIKNESLYNMKYEMQNPVSIERNELLCTETNGERTSVEVSFQFPNHTDFIAGIALRNTVGLSKPSFIVIPAMQQAPKPDLVLVEEGENNFQVSWMWDNRNLSVTTVTYFWCTRNRLRANTTLICEGTLGTHSIQSSASSDWKSFNLNRNNVIIPTSNQSSLYFAVALVQNETSGGMVWQGCKFLKGKAPNKPAYQVNPLETNGTLLQIEIPRVLLCQADNAGRPETYTVSYKQVVDDYKEDDCPQDGFSNQTFEVQLEKEIQHYTLSGLKEGNNYIVCLGSANRDSQTIQYGPSIVIKTARLGVSTSGSLSVSIIIIITVVTVCSAGIFVALFSYLCLKRLRRCMKRPAIIVPDVHHFKKEEVEVYIEVDDLKKMGGKANEINNKNGGLDADSGTGGSVESSCNGDDIEETKYVAPERRDSETSSGGSASYERLVQSTSTSSGDLIKAYEEHLDDRRTNSDSLMKFVMDNPKIITRPECRQVYPVTAASGSIQSYVVAALQEGRNSIEYLPDIDLDRLKLAQKETVKPCIDNPITSLPLKSLTALKFTLNSDWKEQSVHSWLEPQSVAEKMTIKVVPVPCDGSYVQATLEEKENNKRDEEEVEVEELEEQEDEMETSCEENKSSGHHLESADDALCDRVIESLLDSGSTTVVGYVKPIETNLGSGAFCISDASSGFSGSLMPVYIKPAEVTLANNQYLRGMDLFGDEVASIEEIPGNFTSGEPQESSNSQRQSFLNNAASYIQEIPGISISKNHSRDETGSECPSIDEGTAIDNLKCQSKDRILAVNAYTSDGSFNIKEKNYSLHDECYLEKEISTKKSQRFVQEVRLLN
ncbi:hypothetical protein CHS0354_011032 [Potamilus streckersoni]|uniref:Cytokine receptor n=1 Tax=Potamilus streckersoni TaxID=2493646 RepID=A0AAE0WFZ1_9BIVA|nr:hypothetical protein CHS0354_011032 [Potamilus streckersoni]